MTTNAPSFLCALVLLRASLSAEKNNCFTAKYDCANVSLVLGSASANLFNCDRAPIPSHSRSVSSHCRFLSFTRVAKFIGGFADGLMSPVTLALSTHSLAPISCLSEPQSLADRRPPAPSTKLATRRLPPSSAAPCSVPTITLLDANLAEITDPPRPLIRSVCASCDPNGQRFGPRRSHTPLSTHCWQPEWLNLHS